jgi:hypothetical protein
VPGERCSVSARTAAGSWAARSIRGGPASGQCADADGAEAFAEPGGGDGLSWHATPR